MYSWYTEVFRTVCSIYLLRHPDDSATNFPVLAPTQHMKISHIPAALVLPLPTFPPLILSIAPYPATEQIPSSEASCVAKPVHYFMSANNRSNLQSHCEAFLSEFVLTQAMQASWCFAFAQEAYPDCVSLIPTSF